MPGQKDMPRGRLVTRLITFYVILAVIGVAVVVLVISKGGNEKAQPAIAGGYAAAAANPCIGPVPKPAPGIPLPATAPAQAAATGPSFNVLQSGQFVNFTNNQNTLGGTARLQKQTLPGGGHRLTGTINCVSGGRSLAIDAIATPGAKASIVGTARRPSVRGLVQDRAARSGRGRAADADEHPGHVRPVPRLDVLRELVLDPRHRLGCLAVLLRRQAARPAHLLDQDGRGVRRRQVRQGRDRPDDRDRQRHPAPERHRNPAQGGHPGAVEGPDGQAGADHSFGPRPGGREVHRDQAAQSTSTTWSQRCSSRSRSC